MTDDEIELEADLLEADLLEAAGEALAAMQDERDAIDAEADRLRVELEVQRTAMRDQVERLLGALDYDGDAEDLRAYVAGVVNGWRALWDHASE